MEVLYYVDTVSLPIVIGAAAGGSVLLIVTVIAIIVGVCIIRKRRLVECKGSKTQNNPKMIS